MKNSNKILFTLALVFASVFVYAQDKETRSLDKFVEIRVSEGIELIAKKGSENKIELEVDYVDIDRVVTEVRGGSLSVHMERGNYRRKRVKAILTYTEELEEIKVSTAAEAIFEDKIKSQSLQVSTSTSGFVDIQSIEVERLDLRATTSGRIDIEGTADDVKAGASTGGTIYAYDVEARDVRARANTGADIRVNAEDFLTASAGTGGSVKYKGRPRTDVSTNTGGSVRRSN